MEQHPPGQQQNGDQKFFINRTGRVTFYTQAHPEKKKSLMIREYTLSDPLDWGEDCQEQLYLQTKFWNRLVEIDRSHHAATQELISRDHEVGQLTMRIQQLNAQKEEAIRQSEQLQRTAQSVVKEGSEPLDQVISNLSAEIGTLQAQIIQKRKAAQLRNRPQLQQMEESRKAVVKQARRSSGLSSGNCNAVCKAFDLARVRAISKGTELPFHTFDGTGRFINQLPAGVTLKQLCNDTAMQVSIRSLPEGANPPEGEPRQPSTLMAITAFVKKKENGQQFSRTLTFPMTLHPSLPEDAIIKEVAVKRSRAGRSFRWSATITAIPPDSASAPVPSPLHCGIHLGWRSVPEGLRVATLVDSKERVQYIVLPGFFLQRLDAIDQLKSQLDSALNEVLFSLRSQAEIIHRGVPAELRQQIDALFSKPRPAAKELAQLAFTWKSRYSGFLPEIWAKLEDWRKRNKSLRYEWGSLHDRALKWRMDFYRNVAKNIVSRYRMIVLRRIDLQALAAAEREEASTDPHQIQAGKLSDRAAISDLRKWIELRAIRSGAAVLYKQGNLSGTCPACGCVNKSKQSKPIISKFACEGCGRILDPDKNAAITLRDSVTETDKGFIAPP